MESLKLHPQVVDFAGVAAFRSLCSAERKEGEEYTEHRWQLVVEYDAAERSQKNFRPWWLPRRAAALIKFFEPLLSPDLKNICSVVPLYPTVLCFSLSLSLFFVFSFALNDTNICIRYPEIASSAGYVKSSTSFQEILVVAFIEIFRKLFFCKKIIRSTQFNSLLIILQILYLCIYSLFTASNYNLNLEFL